MSTDVYCDFVESNELLNEPARLRERMRRDGYLFFRGMGPKDKIRRARRDILAVIHEAGWIKPLGDDDQAIWSGAGPFTENEPPYMAVYRKILYTPSFNAVPEDAGLIELMGKIVDGPVLAQRLHIGRVSFPQNTTQTTPAHQDFHYIKGTPDTYTMWMPLGDCPRELGGLTVLRGSHREGFIEHSADAGNKYAAAGVPDSQMPRGDDVEWHSGDFEVGDLLIFHSHTIHKALPNLTKDRLRISTDNRYQRQGEKIEAWAMRTHHNL